MRWFKIVVDARRVAGTAMMCYDLCCDLSSGHITRELPKPNENGGG